MSRKRSESSRMAILMAAFELVGEVGYTELTIEGIAARARVGKQTIYRWWPSKGAVLFDAFLALSEDAEGDPSLPDTGDLETDLKLVLRATVEELNDPLFSVPMRAMLAAIASDEELAAEYEQRLEGPMRALKITRLTNAPELPEGTDLELVADLLWSPLLARWQQGRALTPEYADRLVETVLRGVSPRAA